MRLTSLDARIALTFGHLVATCMTAASCGVQSGVAFVIFASFLLAAASLVGGWELLNDKKNALHAVAHCVGGLLQARIMLHDLPTTPSTYLWFVVLLSHAPASAATLDSYARLFAFPHAARA